MYKLFARPGWGSVLVEAQLAYYGLSYDLEEVGDLFADAEARQRLAAINPVAQVPTLLLPGGEVMTESAAITLYLADVTGSDDLVPGPQAPERAAFLRRLVFLVANIYPTFTYADDPARFVPGEEAQKGFQDKVNAYAQRLWQQMEQECAAPWFLGERFSALDIYLCAMTHWRPGRFWFRNNCPKLHAAAKAVEQMPRLGQVWTRNFPPKTQTS